MQRGDVIEGTPAAKILLLDLVCGEAWEQYRPSSAYLSMIHGLIVSGVGYTAGPEARLREGGAFVTLHRPSDTVRGISGINAVGTVYQWAQHLHEVNA